MTPEDASTSQRREPPAEGDPADRAPAEDRTMIIGPLEAEQASSPMIGGLAGPLCPNPTCQQPLGADERFCQVCGTAVGTAVEAEKTRPWFVVVAILWLLLAGAGFVFLYANAFLLGRT